MNSLNIAANLMKRMLGSKKGWISFVIVPAIIVSLLVHFTGTPTEKTVDIPYANNDSGMLSRQLVKELESKQVYRLIKVKEAELKQMIKKRDTAVAFVIPSGFTDSLLAGDHTAVKRYQLSISETSVTLGLSLDQTIAQMKRSIDTVKNNNVANKDVMPAISSVLAQQAKHQVKSVVIEAQPFIKKNLYLIVGFILFFLMGLITSSLGFVLEDHSKRTMARMFTAPVKSYEIAIGNLLGTFALGCLQVLIILFITQVLMGFDYGVPFLPLFAILASFVLAVVGIASTVTGLVRNSANLSGINSLIITPTCMIGGCWWPVSIMPDFMKKLANFVPQKWAIDAVTNMAAGDSFSQISINIGILLLFSIVFLGFGSFILKPTEESL